MYETLQKILDKANKNESVVLTGDMIARVGSNEDSNLVVTNGEAALNNNREKLVDFCTFSNLKITNTLLSIKKSINLVGKLESINQLLIIL
jgi:hypothetical protein